MQVKNRLLILTAGLLALISVTATGVYAQQRLREEIAKPGLLPGAKAMGFPGLDDGSMRLFKMAEELELTREQRDAIFKLIDDARPVLRENLFKLLDSRKELRELMKDDKTVDEKKLRTLTRAQGDAMAELMYKRLQLQSGIRGVLTAEQKAKLKDMRGKHRQMRHDGMPGRPGMQPKFQGWRQSGQPGQGPDQQTPEK